MDFVSQPDRWIFRIAAILAFLTVFGGMFVLAGDRSYWGHRAGRPHFGVAYQTWNRPLGVWQTQAELDQDLGRMAALGARTLRVELVWNMIEPEMGRFDFENADLLFETARRHGLTLYPIIGFQWPPEWMKPEYRLGFQPATPDGEVSASPILNYAHPFARERFARVIHEIVSRYRGHPALGAWILGNEFNFIEYVSQRQLGYDAFTLSQLNARRRQGGKRPVKLTDLRISDADDLEREPVRDFFEYRRQTIADFVGLACRTAKRADPTAPITYSGMAALFSQFDTKTVSEDWALIAEACRKAGAPLDSFSVNAYLNLNSGEAFHLDIGRDLARELTGLETWFSEFGITSTERYVRIDSERQGPLLVSQYLQTIIDGVPGAHVFTWLDKDQVEDRERGFGLLDTRRRPKSSLVALTEVLLPLARYDIRALQDERVRPKARIAFLLSDPAGAVTHPNSFLNELWIVASHFKRYGAEVEYVRPQDLSNPERMRGIELLVLTRQEGLGLGHWERIKKALERGDYHVLSVSGVSSEGARRVFGVRIGQSVRDTRAEMQLSMRFHEGKTPVILPFRTSWRAEGVVPVKGLGVEPAVDAILDDDTPAYYVRRTPQGGSRRAVFVPVSLGHMNVPHIGRWKEVEAFLRAQPNHQAVRNPHQGAARFLKGILEREFGITLDSRDSDLAAREELLTLRKTYALKNGGTVVYLTVIPNLLFSTCAGCRKHTARFTLQGLAPGESFVSLVGGRSFTAGADGVAAVELRSCESGLWVSADAEPRFRLAGE